VIAAKARTRGPARLGRTLRGGSACDNAVVLPLRSSGRDGFAERASASVSERVDDALALESLEGPELVVGPGVDSSTTSAGSGDLGAAEPSPRGRDIPMGAVLPAMGRGARGGGLSLRADGDPAR
jgi:hypothetical protein